HRAAWLPRPAHRAHRNRRNAGGSADAHEGLPPGSGAEMAAVELHLRAAGDADKIYSSPEDGDGDTKGMTTLHYVTIRSLHETPLAIAARLRVPADGRDK